MSRIQDQYQSICASMTQVEGVTMVAIASVESGMTIAQVGAPDRRAANKVCALCAANWAQNRKTAEAVGAGQCGLVRSQSDRGGIYIREINNKAILIVMTHSGAMEGLVLVEMDDLIERRNVS